MCLQKYPPISGNLQNAIDYKIHLTIENHLKVEISVVISKTSTTLPSEKNAWGTGRGVGRGTLHPKFLAFLVIFCFEKRCRKYYCSLKIKTFPAPNLWAGYAQVRIETNIPKNLKQQMLALCPGRCSLHHKGAENDRTMFFPARHSGKCEVCSLQRVND